MTVSWNAASPDVVVSACRHPKACVTYSARVGLQASKLHQGVDRARLQVVEALAVTSVSNAAPATRFA